MKIWKINLRERGILLFLQKDPTKSVGSFGRSTPGEPPIFKIERKRLNPWEEEVPTQVMVALEISKNAALNIIYLMISLLGDR